jgi:DNA-binding response OmpR family regulator
MKVLIAEDDRMQALLVGARMSSRGWTVVHAADAMQATMAAQRESPDVILLDLQMPGGTGIGALRRLKASMKTSGIPVLVMSATTDPAQRAETLALGAHAFFEKPLDLDALYSATCAVTAKAPS